MKKTLLVLGLALLPLAASGQTVAQAPISRPASGAIGSGVTVYGRGTVRVAVKTVQFNAYARGMADDAGVLAVMRAAGIDDPSIGTSGPQLANGTPALLRGTIHDVTRAKLDRIGLAALAYIHTHPGASLDNVTFAPVIDDCVAQEQKARSAAIDDAKRRAQAIAGLTDLTLDGVLFVNENGGCPNVFDGGFSNGPQQQFDLGTMTTLVQINENVTFAVAPSNGARRRML